MMGYRLLNLQLVKKIVDQITTKNLENCVEESWQETVDRIDYLLN